MPFDPDSYLAAKTGFDPDAYLASKDQPAAPPLSPRFGLYAKAAQMGESALESPLGQAASKLVSLPFEAVGKYTSDKLAGLLGGKNFKDVAAKAGLSTEGVSKTLPEFFGGPDKPRPGGPLDVSPAGVAGGIADTATNPMTYAIPAAIKAAPAATSAAAGMAGRALLNHVFPGSRPAIKAIGGLIKMAQESQGVANGARSLPALGDSVEPVKVGNGLIPLGALDETAAASPAVIERGASPGGGARPSADAGTLSADADPIKGLPESSPGPTKEIREAARQYQAQAGLPEIPHTEFVRADPERGARIAQAYEQMPHAPNDPRVKKAYGALIDETMKQWKLMKDMGVKVELIKPGMENPYPKGSPDMIADVRKKHLWVFPTEQGFGDGAITDHPLMAPTGEVLDGHPLVANDVFRAVHDFFGHAKEGVGFGPHGEENAWQAHARMYSPEAVKALTTETRGQNSWVNYGPKGEANRANPGMTTYADQKAGILPDWVNQEGFLYQPEAPLPLESAKPQASLAKDILSAKKKSGGLLSEASEANQKTNAGKDPFFGKRKPNPRYGDVPFDSATPQKALSDMSHDEIMKVLGDLPESELPHDHEALEQFFQKRFGESGGFPKSARGKGKAQKKGLLQGAAE